MNKQKQTPTASAVLSRLLLGTALVTLALSVVLSQRPASAATSSTVNFQARVLTAAGGVVPDGYYNVEFKLYKAAAPDGGETPIQGACTTNPGAVTDEDCVWTETRISGDKVRVANGYLTVNLGSVTAFGGSIPWDQELWLTMNIGGTGTASWDGEMNPRLKLTASPYAMRSGALVSADGAETATIDESGTICIQASSGCGFATATGGAGYIQNQTLTTQTAGFKIDGTGTADILQASTSVLTTLIDTPTLGNTLSIGTTNATGGISLNQNTTLANKTLSITGSTSGTALRVTDASTATVFLVDASNGRVAIGQASASYKLDVNGDVNIASGSAYKINGSNICTSSGCTATATSAIQNQTLTTQTAGFKIDGTGTAGTLQATTSVLTTLLDAPTLGNAINIGTTNATGGITLKQNSTVDGDLNLTSGHVLKINSTTICDSTGCTAKTGSGYYIHNDTVQSTANINVLSAAAGSTTLLVQGAASGTVPVAIVRGGSTPGTNADLLQVQTSASARLVTIDKSGNFGVGSSAPARLVDFYTTSTDNTQSTVRLQQASTGDAVMEFASGKSYFVGVDTGDSNKFKISSSTASSGALIKTNYDGDTGTGTDNGNNNAQSASQITTGVVGGTLSSVSAYFPTVSGTYKMALYSESTVGGSAHPGVVLSSSQVTQTATTGWNTFTLTPVALTANTNYWVVFRVSSASTFYGHTSGSGRSCFTTLNYANAWVPDYDNSVSFSCGTEYYSVYASYAPSTGYDLFAANLLSLSDTGQTIFKNSTDSTTAFQIQNSSATPLFTIDSTNSYVYVGNSTADSTGALLVLDTKNTSGDPTGLNGALYYNSVSNTFKCHEGRRGWQDCLGVPKPNTRRWTYVLPNGDTGGVGITSQGDVYTNSGTVTEVAATSSEPVVLNYASGNVSGNVASGIGNPIYNVSANPMMQAYVAIPTTSSVRVWVGLADNTVSSSATPAVNMAAFRFDTGASDTTYKCVTNDAGVTPTVADSGIAPGTNGRRLEIVIVSATRVEFKIDGAVVCASTTDLPTAGTNLRQALTVTTLTGTARSLKVGWSYVESDK